MNPARIFGAALVSGHVNSSTDWVSTRGRGLSTRALIGWVHVGGTCQLNHWLHECTWEGHVNSTTDRWVHVGGTCQLNHWLGDCTWQGHVNSTTDWVTAPGRGMSIQPLIRWVHVGGTCQLNHWLDECTTVYVTGGVSYNSLCDRRSQLQQSMRQAELVTTIYVTGGVSYNSLCDGLS